MKNSIERALKQLLDVKEDRTISIRPYVYDIGQPKHNYNLCFDDEPSANLYYNSFFIKILSYKSTNQALDCLHYHYGLYASPHEFVNFFENEVLDVADLLEGGIPLPSDKRKRRILSGCLKWVRDERLALVAHVEATTRSTIETEIVDVIKEIRNARIEINPQVDPKKLIFLFLALQRLVVDEKNVGVLKYKHTVELPHLLKYFAPFSDNKVDGIRKLTTLLASEKNLQLNIPDYLAAALTKFFFNESITMNTIDF
ncbi:hypothetical protein [Dyadobacter pollutisoli]|uniref:Uncharacterized protein n=1 Tax=Dyadobacter pollutisoli TaxID=2910158 RepID=A0A9E8NBF7_9BACT|nr:hypothetical protein [Dyadobacter pollutisoli]WAC11244.1 hypothetical protein ON006_26360 [Dyadobacter pollutisoli]